MPDRSEYKVGEVLSVEECGKNLKACKVNVGSESEPITVVTAARNVRPGSRVAVVLVGSTFENDEGEEVEVKKTSVGGIMSEGIFCDSRMLGWTGGAAGIAAQIPESVPVGAVPPTTKPRPNENQGSESVPTVTEGLFEKKLTKEEKKKIAEERRKARKAAKESKKDTKEEGEDMEGDC